MGEGIKTVSARVPAEIKKRLRAVMATRGETEQEILTSAITRYLEEFSEKKPA